MQPTLAKFLKDNPSKSANDYKTMYVGDYKNHHRKIKSVFHSPRILKQRDKQVDSSLARAILGAKY